MENLPNILKKYEALDLKGLKEAHLMNRVDTKFIVPISRLAYILNKLMHQYYILEINDQRNTNYHNLYFDTPEHQFYLNHHNRKDHRCKVRFRKYENTNSTFLEVKNRRKKRTTKERINVANIHSKLSPFEHSFVTEKIGQVDEISPSIFIKYKRISLVNKNLEERFTLDYEIQFTRKNDEKKIDHVIIAELKQQKLNRYSPAFQLMNQIKVQPSRFSKYCMGRVLLSSKESLKYNNFKETLLQLDKLKTQLL